ncbi:MAG TPA: phosphatidate cytidylyltransferase [Gaiellaceae bacterium]|nr:phosphatidate cytidylyltransferase [Gaiellaceae bacterium]
MSPFLSRILVAVVALPVVLGVVWLGGWWLFALVAVGSIVALHEYTSMTRQLRPVVLGGYVGVLAMLVGASRGGIEWLLGGFMLAIAVTFALHVLAETRQPPTVAIGATLLGVAWIGFGLGHLVLLRDTEEGRLALYTVLIAVFAADTLAFFAGRLLGRHKLAPTMSPGKTWEGFVAGTLAAVAVAFFALYEDRATYLSIPQALVLGLVVALAEAAGDLFESALKRDMQVKDTGRLLGGHGGVLDRIDSLLWAGPAAFYLLLAYGHA